MGANPNPNPNPNPDPDPNPNQVWVQARALPLRKVGGLAAEEVFIRTPSMVLAISSDEARKFDGSSLAGGGPAGAGASEDKGTSDESKRAEFAHLRVKVRTSP